MTTTVPLSVGLDELKPSLSWSERRRLSRSPAGLDLRLRVLFLVKWLAFFLLLGGSLQVLYLVGLPFLTAHPIAFATFVLVAAGKHALALFGLIGGEAHLFHEAPAKLRGKVRPADVDRVVEQVAERLGRVRGRPNLYIAIDKEANATCVNSMLFNFIPRYNAVYLNSYLFRALSPDELLAILAHELAHFHRYMGPLARNAWLGVVGSVAACTALWPADEGSVANPILVLIVLWWAPLPFLWLFNKIAAWGQRDLEHACDAIAAEVVGAESMVNALLKMGDRAEIYELIETELARILEENPRTNGAKVVEALLERLPEGPVTPKEARRALRRKGPPKADGGSRKKTGALLETARQNQRLRRALRVVRWSRFDTIRRDGRLDRDELHDFVRSLGAARQAATHEIASEHPDQEPVRTHPSTRKRIVYLYLHFLARETRP
ncbi:MAG: M48 family metalloprotease [Thermoanaerobaculia bacterium]|nr:M48 family metalloprotease [Thermoanaerobaculia bacterium]